MIAFFKLLQYACSKPAKTLFCLLFAIGCCCTIVVVLDKLDTSNEQEICPKAMEFAPKPKSGSVIHVMYKDIKSVRRWTRKIVDFLKPYRESNQSGQIECDFNHYPSANETCKVDTKKLLPCIEELDFGYTRASPCVFLRFKKDPTFAPEYLDMDALKNAGLSSDYTVDIKVKHAADHPEKLKTIWVSCEGHNEYDKTLLGTVNYIPWSGFPNYFFPYHSQVGYMDPLVAIQFSNPRVGIIIDIDCKVVARNFNETISFSLFVDE